MQVWQLSRRSSSVNALSVAGVPAHSMHHLIICPKWQLPSNMCPAIPPMHVLLGLHSSSTARPATAAAPTVNVGNAEAMVLDQQPMLSDMVVTGTGPWETVAWKVVLDVVLPIVCLSILYRLIEWAAERARHAIQVRLQAEGDIAVQLRRRSTLAALVLLALRAPATFVLPPLCVGYVLRTGLHIVDLVVHNYQPQLPQVAEYAVRQVSAQLVPLDTALQTLLSITGALFSTWFFIQLKDILMQDLVLVEAVRSGRKELERIYLPLSSLVTWAAVLAGGMSVCASLGVSLEPLLAVGGAGGIAAGFASQQVLTNIVSGINIFLTRPFVVGDQVKFSGGTDLEGTVEAVEIVRTTLRTTGGTLVAIPNKTVAELIVFNRTRSLAAAAATSSAEDAAAAAAVAAAAAPLRRVLCFMIQLGREKEYQLGEIKSDVRGYLNSRTKQQLVDAGLAAYPVDMTADMTADELIATSTIDEGDLTAFIDQDEQAAAAAAKVKSQLQQQQLADSLDAELAMAPVSAAVTSLVASVTGDKSKATNSLVAAGVIEANSNAKDGSVDEAVSADVLPEPEPLPVSITLNKLDADTISLFVRCELLMPAAVVQQDTIEGQTEDVLIGVSSLVKEKYDGKVLWC